METPRRSAANASDMTPRRSARIAKKRTQVSLENGRGFSLVEKTVVEHGPYFKAYVYILQSFIPLVSWTLSFILTCWFFLRKYARFLAVLGLISSSFMIARNYFSELTVSKYPELVSKYPELAVSALEEIPVEELPVEELPVEEIAVEEIAVEEIHPEEGLELEQVKEKVEALEKVVKEIKIKDLKTDIMEQVKKEVKKIKILERKVVKDMIQQVLRKDSRVDYALKSRGAKIIEASRDYKSGFKSYWLKFLFPNVKKESRNKADEVLEASKRPGECWAMDGDNGFVDIGLSQSIIPESVVVQYASLQELKNFNSAPKWIQVFSQNILIGNGTFDPRVETANILNLKKVSNPVGSLRVHVLSNWGNPNYTCIYKIQIFS
jgi:SUN domain-containing protein 1/2